MATQRYYATRDLKNPSNYGTRMLKAGDPVDLDGPKARLYLALKAVTAEKPKRSQAAQDIADDTASLVEKVVTAKPKPARKRKAAAKKK